MLTNKHIRRGGIAAIGAAGMAGAITLVSNWEGFYPDPYKDIVGVWTVCYGETASDNVAMHHYSKAECEAMLPKSLAKYDDGIRSCITRELPNSMRIAFLSTAYNIGVAGFCRSSMARLANAGEFKDACDALMLWDRAGGREVKGLRNRRLDERRICLKDVKDST